jgi:hypothetical protein
MEQFNAVLNQVLIFLIIMIIGFLAVKAKFLAREALPVITRLFTRVIVPFILFVNTVNGATRSELVSTLYLSGIYVCVFAVLITTTRMLPKILRLKGNKAPLFTLSYSFGNVGFVGIPLLVATFGQRAMLYVTMYAIVDQFIFWTYGYSLSFPVENKLKFTPKTLVNMINPPIIAMILSIVIILLDVRVPELLDRAFTSMAISGTALPFLYIGGMIATLDIKKLLKHYEFYVGITVKMIIIPICIFLVIRAIGINHEIAVSSALLFGLPTIALVPMLAGANGSDVEYGTAVVLVSTVASLFTLTLVSYVTGMLL